MSMLPLEGVRVIEMGLMGALPFAGQWLAWLGAEVVLIEGAGIPSQPRAMPPFAGDPGPNKSGFFNSFYTAKRSLVLNLKSAEGKQVLAELVRLSDVLVDNFSAGAIERLGFGYPMLRRVNPSIIALSLGAFGRSGSLKSYVGLHSAVNAYSGVADVTGYPGGYPRLLGAYYPDSLSGVYAALSVCLAVYHRQRTGHGQYIDAAMCEPMMNTIPDFFFDYFVNGVQPERLGARDPRRVPQGVYRCKGNDAWISLSVTNLEEWRALCIVLGRSGWLQDERLVTLEGRSESHDAIDAALGEWTRTRTAQECFEALQKAGVPSAPSFNIREVLSNAHLNERGFVRTLEYPEAGPRRMMGLPFRIWDAPAPRYERAPSYGEHNEVILRQVLGHAPDEISAWSARDVFR